MFHSLQILGAFADFLDRARHEESLLGDVIVLAFGDFLVSVIEKILLRGGAEILFVRRRGWR